MNNMTAVLIFVTVVACVMLGVAWFGYVRRLK